MLLEAFQQPSNCLVPFLLCVEFIPDLSWQFCKFLVPKFHGKFAGSKFIVFLQDRQNKEAVLQIFATE